MADDTDTPTPTPTEAKKPTTRRRAPRKASGATTAAKKPANRKTAAEPTAASTAAAKAPARRAPAPKPRAASRPAPKAPQRTPTTAAKAKSAAERATDKVGGKWGAAAIAGGLAAVGAAATAALLSLRGSTPKDVAKPKGKHAHQPDGTDSSKSFEAGIADENTIPDKQ